MSNSPRVITARRNLQQMKHCVEEALSILEHNEDPRCAFDDLEQAISLGQRIIFNDIRPLARGYNRGMSEDLYDKRFE